MQKKWILIPLLFLALFLATPVWLTYRQMRQDRLDRALLAAIKRSDTNAVGTLLEEGADANAREQPPDTRSVWQRLRDGVRGKSLHSNAPTALLVLLLRRKPMGSAYNSFNGKAYTVMAAADENLRLTKSLLDHGAQVNITAHVEGRTTTPLIEAAQDHYLATARLLSKAGANVNQTDDDWNSALMYAALGADAPTVQALLDAGADANARSEDGFTVLMAAAKAAAKTGSPTTLKALLAKGADPNAKGELGFTALMLAVPNKAAVELLISKGADVNAKTEPGHMPDTPLTFAKAIASVGNGEAVEVVSLLKRAGAKK